MTRSISLIALLGLLSGGEVSTPPQSGPTQTQAAGPPAPAPAVGASAEPTGSERKAGGSESRAGGTPAGEPHVRPPASSVEGENENPRVPPPPLNSQVLEAALRRDLAAVRNRVDSLSPHVARLEGDLAALGYLPSFTAALAGFALVNAFVLAGFFVARKKIKSEMGKRLTAIESEVKANRSAMDDPIAGDGLRKAVAELAGIAERPPLRFAENAFVPLTEAAASVGEALGGLRLEEDARARRHDQLLEEQRRLVEGQEKRMTALVRAMESVAQGVSGARERPVSDVSEERFLEAACIAEQSLLETALRGLGKSADDWNKKIEEDEQNVELRQVRGDLIQNLPKTLAGYPDLLAMLQRALSPLRELETMLAQIRHVRQLLDSKPEGSLLRLLSLRRGVFFLMMQNQFERDRTGRAFNYEEWAEKMFVPFADSFFLMVQRSGREQKANFDPARAIVARALRIAEIEPIEIVVQQTQFDSSIHHCSSNESLRAVPDGAIVSVIRNGFRSRRTGKSQLAEVIVNRRSMVPQASS